MTNCSFKKNIMKIISKYLGQLSYRIGRGIEPLCISTPTDLKSVHFTRSAYQCLMYIHTHLCTSVHIHTHQPCSTVAEMKPLLCV